AAAPPRGLTLPMRYLLRKRLKNPAPLEVSERRQVGDAESIFGNSTSGTLSTASEGSPYPFPGSGRGSESEL
ncbi:hypothetical protein C8A05DRAFT_18088, partial [Staphylotrichum tortipilum]